MQFSEGETLAGSAKCGVKFAEISIALGGGCIALDRNDLGPFMWDILSLSYIQVP